uniref:Uncharacterized protein n=1 Tax=Timema poppense TaxID=170557 RepID=A0A7R9HD37_TIMPO|nr:unnamed protein product [Timema poppensis]
MSRENRPMYKVLAGGGARLCEVDRVTSTRSRPRGPTLADPGQTPVVMPFIDDDLLWCPDNDGKMVDLSQCLESAGGRQQDPGGGSPGLGELSQSDLTGLVPGLGDEDDIFRQLDDTAFELDNFFTDLENKVRSHHNL